MGDFNNHINWENWKGREKKIEFSWTLQMSALCNNMLWVQPDNNFDLVITFDENNMVEKVSMGSSLALVITRLSDWNQSWTRPQKVKDDVKRPNFFKGDYKLVRKRLKETDLERAIRGMGVNDDCKKLNEVVRDYWENMPMHK